MQFTRLGVSGLRVSRIALDGMSFGTAGTRWERVLDEETEAPIFRLAVEHGVTFWGTASVYARGTSEEITGRAIRQFTRRSPRMAPGHPCNNVE